MLIALGSNLEAEGQTSRALVAEAAASVAARAGGVARLSAFYATPAFPAGSGPDFVNAAMALTDVTLSAGDMLALCHAVEAEMGRVRKVRWGARVIDIDLIAAGDAVLPDRETWQVWADLPLEAQMARAPDGLVLPHPRMQGRGFVLVPLADVAPDWRHPVLGRSVSEMRDSLSAAELAEIRAI